jgi:putative isomerase
MNLEGLLNRWTGGRLFTFSGLDGRTDFFHGLTLRTAFDATGFDIKLPGEGRLLLPGPPTRCVLTGDCFQTESARGALLDAYHLLIEGPVTVSGLGAQLRGLQQGGRTLVGSRYGFDASLFNADLDGAIAGRLAWLRAQKLPARPMLAAALSQMKTMVYAPEGQIKRRFTTPDRWPHRGMWLWDSAFHAIGYRHVDAALAREILSAVFDGQADDGFVPIRSEPHSSHPRFTQPPLLALAAKLVLETDDDRDWLEWIYPRLCRYVAWDLANRDSDGSGLLEWLIEDNVNCRSGESGMDNSTRFDSARLMDATDFNSLIAHECEILAGFAGRLGLPAEEKQWADRHANLCRLIEQRLWNDTLNFYLDDGSAVLASAGFLPLVCGAASPARAAALREHLRNPATFGTPLPVASVAANDPGYARDMWRGPVWVNINWLIARGFDRYGMREEAGRIRAETMTEIERWHARYGTFFEFFDDRRAVDPPQLLRKGRCAPEVSPFHQVFFDYGWTATLYLDWHGTRS